MNNLGDKSLAELDQIKAEKQALHEKLVSLISALPVQIDQQRAEVERMVLELKQQEEELENDRELHDKVEKGVNHLRKEVTQLENEIAKRARKEETEEYTEEERRELEDIVQAIQQAELVTQETHKLKGEVVEKRQNQAPPSTSEAPKKSANKVTTTVQEVVNQAPPSTSEAPKRSPNIVTTTVQEVVNQAPPQQSSVNITKHTAPIAKSTNHQSKDSAKGGTVQDSSSVGYKETGTHQPSLFQWFKEHLEKDEWIMPSTGVRVSGASATTKVGTTDLVKAFEEELKIGTLAGVSLAEAGKIINFSSSPLTVNRLTKNFNGLFGKDVIKSVRGQYVIPNIEELRKQFRNVTSGITN
jgi:hypothetical protein